MNKQEFITHLANQHDCKKVEAEKAIDMFTSSVIDAMGQGNEISLVGFGNFYITKIVPERKLHNPIYNKVFKAILFSEEIFYMI